MLAQKLYNCRSGRDLPSILHIHLTVRCKFGVALLFSSGVIICEKQNSETAIIGQLYALSDAAPRCFLWTSFRRDFCSLVEPQDPSAARLIIWCCSCLRHWGEGCHWNVDQVSPSLIGQWISPCFKYGCRQHRFGATIWTSLECAASQQHNGTSPVFIRRIVLEMELFFVFPSSIAWYIIMFDRLEENGEEQLHLENNTTYEHHDVWTPDLYRCVAEKLHIPVMSALWPQSGVGGVILKTWGNPLSNQRGRDLVNIPMTPLSAWGSYNIKNWACSRRVLGLHQAAEILPKTGSEEATGSDVR